MESGTPTRGTARSARAAAVGTAIALYATFDSLITGLPIAVLAAVLNPLIVFLAAAVLLVLLNIACCNWIERQWAAFIAGNAKRLEAKLDKMRKSRVMRHPVAWITRGSDAWYTLAAALANAIIVMALARFIGGEPVSERRILLGSVAYAICFAATFSVTGFVVADAVRAV